MIVRPGRDADGEQFVALISDCWAEYPGCVMDLDGENPELRALETHFHHAGGALWAAEHEGVVVGMVGMKPQQDGMWELCRLYVSASQRGTGVAADLLRTAHAYAKAAGATDLDLWSDTRFDRAHRFYERQGFVREGGIRALHDKSNSLEFRYAKPLTNTVVRSLDTAACASVARSLGRILQDCVQNGASVSFLPSLSLPDAEAFYRRKSADIAAGHRVLLAAWVDGALAGTVTVDFDTPPNQRHRAEIQKLLVHPSARKKGVGRTLMVQAEQEAMQRGRTLLTLDTRANDHGEQLYRGMGWSEAGRIPGYAHDGDGTLSATVLFYKNV